MDIKVHKIFKNRGCDEEGNIYNIKKNNKIIIPSIKKSSKYSYFNVGNNITIRTHKFVWECFNDKFSYIDCSYNSLTIDHINGNSFDNRICNLQILTRRENLQKYYNKKFSKFLGVYNISGCICSTICVKGKNIYLGSFKSEEEAAKIFDNKHEELYGNRPNKTIK